MKAIKYTIIKSEKQYIEYCKILENLLAANNPALTDEIDLLTLLIEKWDEEHNTFTDLDPVEIIRELMKENLLKSKDLVRILGISKGSVSKILNYHKGLSKKTIRLLSEYFNVSQEAFNRPYTITND